jgi:cytochrome oxidase Cu insertion factor (SCO1/SenC/PrrC family)
MNRKHFRPLTFSTSLVVLLSAWAALLSQLPSATQDSILSLRIKVGDRAPAFALPSADGKTVRLSDYTGRNILIDFYRGYW